MNSENEPTILLKDFTMSLIEKNQMIDVSLQYKNFPVSLVNSIRRIILSEIPNAVFKKVTIMKNNTNCHNEFIKHRVSLIPIFRNKNFKIKSYWNKQLQKRDYDFDEDAIVPLFTIQKQKAKSSHYNEFKIENILTSDFKIDYKQNKNIPIQNYFKKDLYTGDYIKIMLFKNEGEQLELYSTPEVGFAYEHSGFSPIGNVAYHYEKESNVIVEEIKKKKFEQINQERKMKNLTLFEQNGDQHKQFNKSFDLLDADRIYKKNKNGECNVINMDIESIGVIEPLQALLDACYVLRLKVQDILDYSFLKYKLVNQFKLELKENTTKNETKIILYNEDHTLGNLINEYFRFLTIDDVDNILIYHNYKLVHPLEQIIEFNVKINENNEEFSNLLVKETIYEDEHQNKVTYIFVKTLEKIVNDLTTTIDKLVNVQKKTKLHTIYDKPSFEIKEEATKDLNTFEDMPDSNDMYDDNTEDIQEIGF